MATRLHGSKYFSRLDCVNGFWQIKVSQHSVYLTLSSPWLEYSCLRMFFGFAAAPEVFQQITSHLLRDRKREERAMDILIHASTQKELTAITVRVPQRLKETGLKVNAQKIVMNVSSVKFLGHQIRTRNSSVYGTARRQKARTISYLNLYPLRGFLAKDIVWIWTAEHQKTFDRY